MRPGRFCRAALLHRTKSIVGTVQRQVKRFFVHRSMAPLPRRKEKQTLEKSAFYN
jgi:hypothetical protein